MKENELNIIVGIIVYVLCKDAVWSSEPVDPYSKSRLDSMS
jgi:hypothetical protein